MPPPIASFYGSAPLFAAPAGKLNSGLLRRIFHLVITGLALALIFALAALIAIRFAIHGREAEVPKLVGLPTAEARQALHDRGLRLALEDRFYSADVPAGHVVSQMPPPGTPVRRGWQVRAAESLGPQRIAIPNVVGQSERAAEIDLRRRGLEVAPIALLTVPGAAPGKVISQSPPPGAAGVSSPRVSLLVSSGSGMESMAAEAPDANAAQPAQVNLAAHEFRMPNVVGRPLIEARTILERSGLPAQSLQGPTDPDADGKPVTRQSPPAGQKITAGVMVTLEVEK